MTVKFGSQMLVLLTSAGLVAAPPLTIGKRLFTYDQALAEGHGNGHGNGGGDHGQGSNSSSTVASAPTQSSSDYLKHQNRKSQSRGMTAHRDSRSPAAKRTGSGSGDLQVAVTPPQVVPPTPDVAPQASAVPPPVVPTPAVPPPVAVVPPQVVPPTLAVTLRASEEGLEHANPNSRVGGLAAKRTGSGSGDLQVAVTPPQVVPPTPDVAPQASAVPPPVAVVPPQVVPPTPDIAPQVAVVPPQVPPTPAVMASSKAAASYQVALRSLQTAQSSLADAAGALAADPADPALRSAVAATLASVNDAQAAANAAQIAAAQSATKVQLAKVSASAPVKHRAAGGRSITTAIRSALGSLLAFR
jgi:hypothetical protein